MRHPSVDIVAAAYRYSGRHSQGQPASVYVRLALIDALQRDMPREPLNTEQP